MNLLQTQLSDSHERESTLKRLQEKTMLALQASSQTVQVSSSEVMWQKLIQEMHGQIERLEGEV